MFSREKILYEGDTELGHYQVVDMVYEGRRARILFSGNREAAFSGIPLDGGHDMLFDYIQRFYELTAHVRPGRLLLIGGGVFTLPMALVQTLPDIVIDTVEIDPGLKDLAEGFFGLQPHPRLNIYHQDGIEFIKQTGQQYGMIIIDAFTHLKIPEDFTDANTVRLLKKQLGADGLIAINVISSHLGRRSHTIHDFYNLYQSVFSNVQVHPADPSVSPWLPQNLVLVACKDRRRSKPYNIRYAPLALPYK